MSQIREVINDSQFFTELDRHRNDIMLLLRSSDGRKFVRPFRCHFPPERTRKERLIVEAFKTLAQAIFGIFICVDFESSFPVCLQCPGFAKIVAEGFPDNTDIKLVDIYSKDQIHPQTRAR